MRTTHEILIETRSALPALTASRERKNAALAAIAAGADAVLAASIFHYGKVTIGEVKESIKAAGYTVR